MRSLSAAMLAVQASGYPTGVIKPAIQSVFTHGATTYDYSFDPTVTTNRLLSIERWEEPFGRIEKQSASILLRDNDRAVPDLTGYHVDLKYGMNTSTGLSYASLPVPRLWVYSQDSVSSPRQHYKLLEMWDVWQIMRYFPIALGTSPHFQADDGDLVGGSLFSLMTIYEILDWVIDSFSTTAACGTTFVLDALGDQDDGIISVAVPLAADTGESIIFPNRQTSGYQSFASFISDIMQFTHSRLRALGNTGDGSFHFKVIYPQNTDLVNEQYYSDPASGHVFYENHDKNTVTVPNYTVVYGSEQQDLTFAYSGDAYDATEFPSPPAYNGNFMAIPAYFKDERLGSNGDCENRAAAILNNVLSQTRSGRVTVPHEARVELFDKVAIFDTRGT